MVTYDKFQKNCTNVQELLVRACQKSGRNPDEAKLLPVAKTHPGEAVCYAGRFGFASVGENRVQEGVAKMADVDCVIGWELIGHLQRNKARLAVMHFDRIQSVDNEKLAKKLDSAAADLGKKIAVLMQVNSGADEAKYGVSCEAAAVLLEFMLNLPHLKVEGLMTVAPLNDDLSVAARAFSRLAELRNELEGEFKFKLPELSMGMTNDMEEAIKAGSTMIRVGRALFGER